MGDLLCLVYLFLIVFGIAHPSLKTEPERRRHVPTFNGKQLNVITCNYSPQGSSVTFQELRCIGPRRPFAGPCLCPQLEPRTEARIRHPLCRVLIDAGRMQQDSRCSKRFDNMSSVSCWQIDPNCVSNVWMFLRVSLWTNSTAISPPSSINMGTRWANCYQCHFTNVHSEGSKWKLRSERQVARRKKHDRRILMSKRYCCRVVDTQVRSDLVNELCETCNLQELLLGCEMCERPWSLLRYSQPEGTDFTKKNNVFTVNVTI